MRCEPCDGLPMLNLETHGYVWKPSTPSVTPPKQGNNEGDETFLESHALSNLPVSPVLDTPTSTRSLCSALMKQQHAGWCMKDSLGQPSEEEKATATITALAQPDANKRNKVICVQ